VAGGATERGNVNNNNNNINNNNSLTKLKNFSKK
jgi:hypothetical protein